MNSLFRSRTIPVLALAGVLVFNTGCGTVQGESVAFAAILTAADAIIASLGIAGAIPAGDVANIEAVTNSVVTASQETTTELASTTDTTAVKSAAIAGYWNAVLTTIKGLSPIEQAILAAVSADIQAYINIVAPTGAVAAVDGSLVVHSVKGTVIIPPHVGLDPVSNLKRHHRISGQQKKLAKLHS